LTIFCQFFDIDIRFSFKIGVDMLVLVFYVPLVDKEKVKQSCFSAGAGLLGNYDQCCFETLGVGQFRPLKGSSPSIGELHTVEKVEEVRVEMIVKRVCLNLVIQALKAAHPYEEVAFHVIETLSVD
jgi:hypothetical protein